ncbi:MAG: Fpg/Nei family DNA glycosylase [Candidatus Aminicenantes bacterium]|nr:Fpg/Nei family DNA glycosylase [Candidatus Aminicenantes bacterium]
MPELPDVEVFRQYMNQTSLHKNIIKVQVDHSRVLQDITPSAFKKRMKGRRFEKTRRHGKHMFACVDDEFWIMFHFGMTGFFKYFKRDQEKPSHTRIMFDFENGYHLAYDSQRMLGKVQIVDHAGDFILERGLGQDALDISGNSFQNKFQGRRGAVKTSLMNQSLLAGVGNIYSDEILFQSRIHPKEKVKKLEESQIKTLHRKMRAVLKKAIEKKADPGEFPDNFLIPFREKIESCPRCGGKINKIKVNSRGTYFCPKCQPLSE